MIPAEIIGIDFTYIERKIMEKLGTGDACILEELAMYDPQVEHKTVQSHIQNIRKKILYSRFRIHSGYEDGKLVYRLTCLLPSATALR